MNSKGSCPLMIVGAMAGLVVAGCMASVSEPVVRVETRVGSEDGRATLPAPRGKAEGMKPEAKMAMKPAPAPQAAPPLGRGVPQQQDQAPQGHLGNVPVELSADEIRPGMLTAGSIDDNERYDAYRSYLATAWFDPPFQRVSLGDRAVIRVTNARGQGVGDARLIIRPAPFQASDRGERGFAPADLTTGSDGRAIFFTELDAQGLSKADLRRAFLVTVQPADGSPPVTRTFSLTKPVWEIRLASNARELPKHLDIALVVDTTGSMGDELEYLKVEIDSIAGEIARQYPEVDARFALVAYRDVGEPYVTRSCDFGSVGMLQRELEKERATGGGDYPEAVHTALQVASGLSWRGRETARMLFLIGDAPPHDEHAQAAFDQVLALRKRGVRIFPIAASGVSPRAEYVFRAAAATTQGQYLFLTDHSGVGNSHAVPRSAEYRVERLNEMLVRLVASELAGERLESKHVLAAVNQQQIQTQRPSFSVEVSGASWSFLEGAWPRWTVLGLALFSMLLVDAFARRNSAMG